MICKALRTDIGVPSASRTLLYWLNTPMPGPMADCAKSTGAILLSCNFFSAGRSSRRKALTRFFFVVCGASSGRLRQTRTIDDANALRDLLLERTQLQVELKVDVAAGQGGTFDYEAGNIKRAPKWIQKIGMEWFWRLILQPSRIKRMYVLPIYLFKIIFTKDMTKSKWEKEGNLK